MAHDDASRADEDRRTRRLKEYHTARAAYEAQLKEAEQLHMGHEQLDNNDHFGEGMIMYGTLDHERPADASSGPDAAGPTADTLNTFERVFGQDAPPPPSGPVPSIGPPGFAPSDKLQYPTLYKDDFKPPPRPKFLHGVAASNMAPFTHGVSPAMQAHLDSLNYASGSAPQINKSSWRCEVEASVTPGFGQLSARGQPPGGVAVNGGGGGSLSARTPQEDAASKRFAWNSERIAHELVCKFDQFTRRREDHMRKLLWTFGSDPQFESENKNAVHVKPSNFNRVCDRFGLVCDQGQAHEIFRSHNLPEEGCNLYTLAKTFLDTEGSGLTRQSRKTPGALVAPEHPGRLAKAQPPPADRPDPFKLARLPDSAWRDHQRLTGAAAAPFATAFAK